MDQRLLTGALATVVAFASCATVSDQADADRAPSAAAADSASADGGLIQVAKEHGSLATLVRALEAADLVAALQLPGPFTLFAPNDAAFAKLPAGELDRWLADPEALRGVLLHHVVPGELPAITVAGMELVRTLGKGEIEIDSDVESVRVGGARVIAKDISCRNGVIHVVDTVLRPQEEK